VAHKIKFDRKLIVFFALAGLLPVIYFRGIAFFKYGLPAITFQETINFLIQLITSCAVTLVISISVISGNMWLQGKLPWGQYVWKRIAAEVLLSSLISVVAMLVVFHPLYLLNLMADESQYATYKEALVGMVFVSLIMNAILTPAYEGIFLFRMWMQSKIERERLQKEHVLVKYETLKNQVNPHFLFNSLNTLSSLVHSDPDKAEHFIEELSKVYRYVLEKRNDLIVPLKDELAFIRAYLFLQGIRFDKNLSTSIDIPNDADSLMIPPLSLQTAIENCIKHNEISAAHPLNIQIRRDGKKVVIINNLQPKTQPEASTGTGIRNLMERYEMLDKEAPRFYIDKDRYIAEIPLIQS